MGKTVETLNLNNHYGKQFILKIPNKNNKNVKYQYYIEMRMET